MCSKEKENRFGYVFFTFEELDKMSMKRYRELREYIRPVLMETMPTGTMWFFYHKDLKRMKIGETIPRYRICDVGGVDPDGVSFQGYVLKPMVDDVNFKIEILEFSDNAIARATSECYQTDPKTPGLVERTLKKGQYSILRHGFATVAISGISRSCGRQLLRKAHASYLEMSQRYCDMSKAKFILPEKLQNLASANAPLHHKMSTLLEEIRCLYKELRKEGVLKEDARSVLPQCIETSMTMSGNLEMWWDFFNLRINKRTQKETRDVAIEILQKFNEQSSIFAQHPKVGFDV